METSSTTSHVPRGPNLPATRQATTPPPQRRQLSESPHRPNHPDTRPKTMFIAAAPQDSASHTNLQPQPPHQQNNKLQQQPVDITARTAKKKRRAPAPPGPLADSPSAPSSLATIPPEDQRSRVHNGGHLVSETLNEKVEEEQHNHQREQEQAPPSRAELLSRLHSRNSSDSSGYHELPLSGAESPEAPGFIEHQTQHQDAAEQLKYSSASLSSGLDGSGANGDSGVHDLSPSRVSPIQEVSEKPDLPALSSEMAVSVSAPASSSGAGKKRRKAPAPPAPVPSSESPRPPDPVSAAQPSASKEQTPDIAAVEIQIHATLDRPAESVPSQFEADESSGKESAPKHFMSCNIDMVQLSSLSVLLRGLVCRLSVFLSLALSFSFFSLPFSLSSLSYDMHIIYFSAISCCVLSVFLSICLPLSSSPPPPPLSLSLSLSLLFQSQYTPLFAFSLALVLFFLSSSTSLFIALCVSSMFLPSSSHRHLFPPPSQPFQLSVCLSVSHSPSLILLLSVPITRNFSFLI